MEPVFKHEQLPSGKVIMRLFADDGTLLEERHTYGVLDIGIQYDFSEGAKIAETYFAKRRIVGRRTYEKARVAYADMPPADAASEDFGASLLATAQETEADAAACMAHGASTSHRVLVCITGTDCHDFQPSPMMKTCWTRLAARH